MTGNRLGLDDAILPPPSGFQLHLNVTIVIFGESPRDCSFAEAKIHQML